MIKLLLLLFLIPSFSGFALRIDPKTTSFSQKEKKHVECYDFSGDYPELKDIDIDAKRKSHVEVLLNGHYPLLEKIHFDGGFGIIAAHITGLFPKLEEFTLSYTDANLDLDLDAEWKRECIINIVGKGPMTIRLPKDVGCLVKVLSSPFQKINNQHPSLIKTKTKIGKCFQRIFQTPKEDDRVLLQILINADREEIIFL